MFNIAGKKDTKKSEESRLAIANAAFEEFSEKGYYGATMRKIAARAGVREGLIYHYYEDKEDLFFQILRENYISTFGKLITDWEFPKSDKIDVEPIVQRIFSFFKTENTKLIRLILTTLPTLESKRKDQFLKEVNERAWVPMSEKLSQIAGDELRSWINPYIFFRIIMGGFISFFLFQEIMDGKRVINLPEKEYSEQLTRLINKILSGGEK